MTPALLMEPKAKGFQSLDLSSPILAALERAQYRHPTPIQAALIPHALDGQDVIGQAQTGTGKTAAFLLPFLDSWEEEDNRSPGPQALVLAPTRELVVQIYEEAKKLVPSPKCRALPIYGGQRFGPQLDGLRAGIAIAIGTPGRVIDHLGRGTLNLQGIRYVVLDEADRMLDIGFRPDIEKILRRCPTDRQTMLLSATVPPPVLRLTTRYMIDPIHINLSPKKVTVEKIKQSVITVDEDRKLELLLRVLLRERPKQCIIFCQRKRSADELYRHLRKRQLPAAAMHGDLPQPQREKILQSLRDGRLCILVATDVVGRGIDVSNISHIINYDLPEDPENYVHRIGRTGRMGADGVAISFVTPEQGEVLTEIEMYINQLIAQDQVDGFEAARKRVKAPSQPAAPKSSGPVFGRSVRRYSQRL